jgi:oligoendopeptidase F
MDLDAYRTSAEAFLGELTGEYYRHYAGLSESYEIEQIYDAHPDLFTRTAVEDLRDRLAAAAPQDEAQRRLRLLLDFATEGYLGQSTKEIESELARREAGLKIEVGGETIGFRESSLLQMNEPDAARREAIELARLQATEEHLNPLYRQATERQQAISRTLGYASYRELCEVTKALDLEGLHRQTESFARATDADYPRLLDPEARRVIGIGVDELRRSDLPRFFRAPDEDAKFPAGALISSFVETMSGLGIDVRAQAGVVLDAEPRPNKSPRAFCAPVRSPGEIYLVIAPSGGWDDYSALFHEGGHTEHFAHVDPALPFEFRRLGDNAITECFAFLFEHLVENPEWLARHLGIEDAERIAGHARAQRLVYLRRYTAKLAYELELHADEQPLERMAERYSELLGGALHVPWQPQSFLADVDPGFYCACYLRAWALETHLRRYLHQRHGPAWFDSAAAGEELRSLWSAGQRQSAEELLEEIGGERLDFGVLRDDLGLVT